MKKWLLLAGAIISEVAGSLALQAGQDHPAWYILAAIGYAGIGDLDVSGIRVWLGSDGEEVLVAEQGGRAASYREEDGARIMKSAEIAIRVDLGRGQAAATLWTCDFSYDYVKINADYRS